MSTEDKPNTLPMGKAIKERAMFFCLRVLEGNATEGERALLAQMLECSSQLRGLLDGKSANGKDSAQSGNDSTYISGSGHTISLSRDHYVVEQIGNGNGTVNASAPDEKALDSSWRRIDMAMTDEKRKFLREVRTRLFDKGTTLPLWCRQNGFDEKLAQTALARHALSPLPPRGFKTYRVLKALEEEIGMKVFG